MLCGEITYVEAQVVYTLDCNGTVGDAVKVVQNQDVLTLCEVQVYGKMVDGKMGKLILGNSFGIAPNAFN